MQDQSDFETLKILVKHKIPRGITLEVDKTKLIEELIESGLNKRFVRNLIKVLSAGITLDIDWEYLDDYDRGEMESRITRRTILKTEIVSEILGIIYEAFDIKPSDSFNDLEFEKSDKGIGVRCKNKSAITIDIPHIVVIDDELYEVSFITNQAFEGCKSLSSITIPDTITHIGERAFFQCESLNSITITKSVLNIGIYAFSFCKSLVSIETSPENEYYESTDGVLYSKDMKLLIRYPPNKQEVKFNIPDSVTEIGIDAFGNCILLTSVEMPESITEIGNYSFNGCKSLISITIPESVTVIGSSSFEECESLTSITIPESVTEIGDYAFSKCQSLKNISLPNSITTIEYDLFSNCYSLDTIIIPNSIVNIGENAFGYCNSLISITIPDSVTEIGDDAFSYCKSLISIDLPNYITTIPAGLLENTSIRFIKIPDSVVEIGKSAFYNCESLRTIEIPNSVKTIGNLELFSEWYGTFERCISLERIVIPESMELIGHNTFKDCKSLKEIVFLGTIEYICYDIFEACDSLKTIYVPSMEMYNRMMEIVDSSVDIIIENDHNHVSTSASDKN